RDALNVQWSPDGDELSIGGFISNMGLWIYSLKSHNATKILRGPGASACWAPDRRQLAACLGPPFFAIWLAELTADRPTAGSFEPVRTPREHNHSLIEKFTREIKADPGLIYAYHQRADCALWTGDEKAAEYLHEFDRVLSVCDASGCASHARRILDWPREQRDRLLPLALMLARKAVTEEPDNREYQDVLEKALELHP
ncbi:MAG: hypothetical protein JW955_16260, partial [Sedimentisphaerales bacterium]|nr:hypothetical protein [Sedimentisphaerales bacterium]